MNALPAPIPAVLELFATSLSDVRFADIDGGVLSRLAAEVEAAAVVVVTQQAALDAARAALNAKQEELSQRVQRAVAYARVYAEADPALAERLDAIALPRSTGPRAARRSRGAAAEPVAVTDAVAEAAAEAQAVVTEVVADDVEELPVDAAALRKGKRRQTVRTVSAVDG